jgi:hypothetical protein
VISGLTAWQALFDHAYLRDVQVGEPGQPGPKTVATAGGVVAGFGVTFCL